MKLLERKNYYKAKFFKSDMSNRRKLKTDSELSRIRIWDKYKTFTFYNMTNEFKVFSPVDMQPHDSSTLLINCLLNHIVVEN